MDGGAALAHVSVVLVRPRQPGNIGMAARAIANHGLGGLVLVDPRGYDPERARWMAPGAGDVVDRARIVARVAEAVAGAQHVVGTTGRRRRWDWPVWGPSALHEAAASGEPMALLFGPEDAGLSNEDMALCTAALTLPTASHASLNLGQAVTVIAAGLLQSAVERDASAAPGRVQASRRGARLPEGEPADEPLADAVARQAAVEAALAALDGSSWLEGRSREQVQGTLYRLLSRAAPTARELGALRGMIKAVSRKDQTVDRT